MHCGSAPSPARLVELHGPLITSVMLKFCCQDCVVIIPDITCVSYFIDIRYFDIICFEDVENVMLIPLEPPFQKKQ